MILMNNFKAEPEELRRRELEAVQRVLASGWFILGDELEQFEQAWAKFCGAKFCVGVGNGMEAIEVGLRALDIGPGDEVITTPMTAIASVIAIMHAGAIPVLADIQPATALLDPASVERCITARTKAVLLVHLYGQLREMERWTALCKGANIHLLEDCAQAHGALWHGRHAGVFGTFGAFSFYPTKNLAARGDSGALITNSSELAARAKSLRNYGASNRYEHPEIGLNSRLDELQAAILSAHLDWLPTFNARRREIAQKYFHEIDNDQIELLSRASNDENHVYHLFVVRCAERNRLADFLRQAGIQTLIHYPIAAHRQECCKNVSCDPLGLPESEAHAAQCLSLPCHPQLSDDEVNKIITTVNAFK